MLCQGGQGGHSRAREAAFLRELPELVAGGGVDLPEPEVSASEVGGPGQASHSL